jgi:hypothetical protein
MAEKTKIAWTHHTWNPWRGCTKISPGCKNCYMFTGFVPELRLVPEFGRSVPELQSSEYQI